MRRTGFMYSAFALFILSLLIAIVAQPVEVDRVRAQGEAGRLDESYYFLQSVEDDIDRAARISGKRAFSAAINVVSDNSHGLPDPAAAVASGFRNGSMNGSQQDLLEDSSVRDWQSRMEVRADAAGWTLALNMTRIEVGAVAPITGVINATFDLRLVDPATDASFDRTIDRNISVSVQNMTDPLLLLATGGRYSKGFAACAPGAPATRLGTGSEHQYDDIQNWTAGRAVLRPANGSITGGPARADQVAVVGDLCNYSESTIQTELGDFAGVVSGQDAGMSADGSTACGGRDTSDIPAYVGGAQGALDAPNRSLLVLTEGEVWHNRMRDRVASGCYFSAPRGPTVVDRLGGRTVTGAGTGWGSFLFIPDLPADVQDTSRSALDYVYVNSSVYGTTHRIKGVTDAYPWFKLDQFHVDRWGVSALTYD